VLIFSRTFQNQSNSCRLIQTSYVRFCNKNHKFSSQEETITLIKMKKKKKMLKVIVRQNIIVIIIDFEKTIENDLILSLFCLIKS
jgi:hypothetical protein